MFRQILKNTTCPPSKTPRNNSKINPVNSTDPKKRYFWEAFKIVFQSRVNSLVNCYFGLLLAIQYIYESLTFPGLNKVFLFN